MELDERTVCYVDTSALVKRYVAESGSEAFDDFCTRPHLDSIICPLGLTEFSSVLRTRIRMRKLTVLQVASVRQRFLSDLAAGGWRLVDFDSSLFSSADILISELETPIATLDALHLACALAHRASELATGDRQLATAARKAALRVHVF